MHNALLPTLCLSLTISILSQGCNTGSESPIRGQLSGAEGGLVTISSLQRNGYIPFDTAMVDGSGGFSFAADEESESEHPASDVELTADAKDDEPSTWRPYRSTYDAMEPKLKTF